MKPKHAKTRPALSQSFQAKKLQILASLATFDDEQVYTDNSPKGSVDVQIRELIAEINAYEGLVTTSSCAGRVAVFVEGPSQSFTGDGDAASMEVEDGSDMTNGVEQNGAILSTGPGGKGGGKWLYVSHDPIDVKKAVGDGKSFHDLFGLRQQVGNGSDPGSDRASTTEMPPRLIHLSFSPLILHVLCSSLHHAKPVLAAAVNAGFRESGVQSLKGLVDPKAGTMIGIRTAGLAFETVIGVVEGDGELRSVVTEEYLKLCVTVINERFNWNERRKERLVKELKDAIIREGLAGAGALDQNGDEWEDKEERRSRKKAEGLRRQKEVQNRELRENTAMDGEGGHGGPTEYDDPDIDTG